MIITLCITSFSLPSSVYLSKYLADQETVEFENGHSENDFHINVSQCVIFVYIEAHVMITCQFSSLFG